MAIIAVALAPQVMKWVENSRKSTDIENYNALVEAATVCSTNEDVIAQVKGGTITIVMDQNGSGSGISGAFKSAMDITLPGWTGTKITSGDWKNSTFNIEISNSADAKGIAVTKGSAGHVPVKDFD
jgi:predicted RNA-binding protein with PUA domain